MLMSQKFWKVGVGNFGKVEVGVGYFTSDSATLISTLLVHPSVWHVSVENSFYGKVFSVGSCYRINFTG